MRLNLPKFSRIRFTWPTALIVIGCALLAYVGWQYGSMYFEQKQLSQEFERQNSAALRKDPHAVVAGDGLTKLTIPKINLDAIVIPGTGRKQLMLGPGWMENTAAPGENGNSVITGHRDTFFRHIYELNKGDIVEVRRNGQIFKYEVTGKRIVAPTDLSVLRQSNDRRLTLITCYPIYYIGPAPNRLVVFTKAVDDNAEPNKTRVNAVGAGSGGIH